MWSATSVLIYVCILLQTGDLGLDIGAQGEPLGYRQEGKPPPHLWLEGFQEKHKGDKEVMNLRSAGL